MDYKHFLLCEAPICADDTLKNDIVWYPGEPVCRKKPYTKLQKNQLRINALYSKGLLKNPDQHFTTLQLKRIKRVRPEIYAENLVSRTNEKHLIWRCKGGFKPQPQHLTIKR